VRAITQGTNQNYQTISALFKKLNILKKTNVVSHIKSRNAYTLFSPILVSGCKYRILYQRVLTTTTLAIHTQTPHGHQLSICA
jgi:hypothetical protein